MDIIENLLAQYPAIISTVVAGATLSAVIIALYLARRQFRSRLLVYADINLYISSEAQSQSPTIDTKDAPKIITVTIRNVGPVTVTIPYWSTFVWSVPGGKEVAMQIPVEPDYRSQPIELLPGKSASIVLSDDLPGHKTSMRNLADKSWLGTWSLRFPKLTIRTEIGDRFRARLGKSLRELARS